MGLIDQIKKKAHQELIFKFSKTNRLGIASNYLKGTGIEIGALNYPLKVPAHVNVKYLDRMSAEDHLAIFKDYKIKDLVKVDIIGNGETLDTVGEGTQDFVIANHFIEHCQNPIMTIENMLRVLKTGGLIFMAIPDKRYTFDINRKTTTMKHFIKDYEEGPAWSERRHYLDFVKNTEWSKDATTDEDIRNICQHLKDINFSIHYHVWTHSTMIDFFETMLHKLKFRFEIILAVAPHNGSNESIFILRKRGAPRDQLNQPSVIMERVENREPVVQG